MTRPEYSSSGPKRPPDATTPSDAIPVPPATHGQEDIRSTTDTFRGIAITAVILTHYAAASSLSGITLFGNVMIAFFFLCSGYGCRASLDRSWSRSSASRATIRFYFKRGLSLLPILWISWIIIKLLVKGDGLTLLDLFGIGTERRFWFVFAIAQCYLIAPLLYPFIRRFPVAAVAGLTLSVVLINVLWEICGFSSQYENFTTMFSLTYRNQLCLHNLIFTIGMIAPELLGQVDHSNVHPRKRVTSVHFWVALAVSICIMYLLTFGVAYSVRSANLLALPMLVGSPLLVVLLFLTGMLGHVSARPFQFLGRCSYPLYLLHMPFTWLLANYSLFPVSSGSQLIVFLSLHVPLLLLCVMLERTRKYISHAGDLVINNCIPLTRDRCPAM